MKIAIIDNYDSFVYNLVHYISELVDEVRVFRNDAIDYSYVDQANAIVLSPGPGIPMDAGDLMKVIDRYHASMPILGVCLGHQALAEYFGYQLARLSTVYHGKSTEIEHCENSPLFTEIPRTLAVGRYHSWTVLPNSNNSLEVTATGDGAEIMAMQHSTLPLQGVQFHPESILTPDGRTMINNWISSIQTHAK